jgi:hypothetical protein
MVVDMEEGEVFVAGGDEGTIGDEVYGLPCSIPAPGHRMVPG